MDYNKPFNFLKNLPPKLNSFYKLKSKSGLVVSNKSKSKKDFDPVTNFDKAFELSPACKSRSEYFSITLLRCFSKEDNGRFA